MEAGARRVGVDYAEAETEGDRSRSSVAAVRDVMGEVGTVGLGEARSQARVGRCRSSQEGHCCMLATGEDWRRGLERGCHR
jgi:hypothetical protein